ncbi:MAG TPA: four helix bundle protein [Candidatus Edwardsbacteria bacterium]|nr:four helix bundle protein [Candidatus Edwardsbacteria bacterium]
MGARCFEQVLVWQRAHQLVLSLYRYSDQFPRKEVFCLVPQLRRAAISVPANIAEGFKKKGKADKLRYMNISQGSLEEVRYYLILARDLGYGDITGLMAALEDVSKLLEGYIHGIITHMWAAQTHKSP